jgi:hypothetical protein
MNLIIRNISDATNANLEAEAVRLGTSKQEIIWSMIEKAFGNTKTIICHSDDELRAAMQAEGLTASPLPNGMWLEVQFKKPYRVIRFEMPYRNEAEEEEALA